VTDGEIAKALAKLIGLGQGQCSQRRRPTFSP